jgi:hypothetical protein
MKRFLSIVSLLAMVPASSFAWEHPKNPDRFPSIGFTYSSTAEEGEMKTQGATQDVETAGGALVLDTRLPLSNSFTLNVGLGLTASTVEGKDNQYFYGSETDTKGGTFFIGGRYYFNK